MMKRIMIAWLTASNDAKTQDVLSLFLVEEPQQVEGLQWAISHTFTKKL